MTNMLLAVPLPPLVPRRFLDFMSLSLLCKILHHTRVSTINMNTSKYFKNFHISPIYNISGLSRLIYLKLRTW